MPNTSNESSKLRRVQWVGSEWDKVAKEVVTIKPSIINSETLLDLDRATFLKAQSALPQDRQRNPAGIPSLNIVRPRLLESLKKIRAELQAQEAERKAQEAKEASARAEAEAAAAYVPPPPPNPYEVAFAPLVNLIANQVASIIRQDLQDAFAQLNPKAAPVEFSNLPNVVGQVRPKFAILGPLPVQQNDISKAFPQVDFIFFEDSRAATVERMQNVDYIIGMVDFLRHGTEWGIKAKLGDKYRPVNGNSSAVKRLIGILLHSMGHKTNQPETPGAKVVNLH